MSHREIWILLLLIALALVAPPTSAQTPTPTGVPVAASLVTGRYDDTLPALAYNPARNEFLLVWEESRPGQGQGIVFGVIYAQRLTAEGALIGQPVRVSSEADDTAYRPDVAYNPVADVYMVVWHAYLETRPADIYGRLLSPLAEPLGDIYPVSAVGASQREPVIAVNPADGTAFCAWADNRDVGLEGPNVYGVRLDAGGRPTGADVPVARGEDRQLGPAIAYNRQAREYLVAWSDWRNDPGEADIYAQRIAADGALLGENVPVTTAPGNQQGPALVDDSQGDSVLALWHSEDEAGSADVVGRLMAPAGPVGAVRPIAEAVGEQRAVAAAHDQAGQYLVVWQDSRLTHAQPTPVPFDIMGRCVEGQALAPGPLIEFATASGDDRHPAVAYAPGARGYLLVWQHREPDGVEVDADIWGLPVSACVSAPTPTPRAGALHLPLIWR